MATQAKTRYLRAHLVVTDVFTNIMRKLVRTMVMCTQNFCLMLQQRGFQKILLKTEKRMVNEVVNTKHVDLFQKLDITICYKIVRFFKYTQAPRRGWGVIPTRTDQTLSDDIERIRIARNELAHMPHPEFTESRMEVVFADYFDISQRFDIYFQTASNNGYHKAVDDYKNMTVDPAMEAIHKKQISRLEEKYSSLLSGQRKITIFLDRDINDMFSSNPSEGQLEQKIKIHLPGVIDSDKICKVLSSIVMEVMQQNYDIVLDSIGEGSLILFATARGGAATNEEVFLEQVKQLVNYLIQKGNINFESPEKTDLVVVLSDPLIDYDKHKIFDEFGTIYESDATNLESMKDDKTEEEIDLNDRSERATLQIQPTSLDQNEVAKIMERALRRNEDNIRTELRLIIIGKTGVGKSALGNLISHGKHFKVDDGIRSCTDACKRITFLNAHRRVTIIDTPGLFNTERSPEYIEEQIRLCIGMGAPGPHAVLYVMSHDSRFREEDTDSLKQFISFFGEEMLKYVIVVFTHADKVGEERIKGFTKSAPPKCLDLLKICGNRLVHVDNLADGQDRQKYLDELHSTIDKLKLRNFENGNFKVTEKLVKERENEIATVVKRNVSTIYESNVNVRARELLENEIQNIQKQLLHRFSEIREEVRMEIELNKAQFVISECDLKNKPY